MRISDHRMEGANFALAENIGGWITPEIVILHDTAGRLEKGNSAAWLRDNPAGVSVHFVVERDGTVEQLVPTNRRAGHAGKSVWNGRPDCNDFSIGIEIVNPGKLTRVSGGGAVSWWGQEFGYGAFNLADITTKEHGSGTWMPYTVEQIEAVQELLRALFAGVPTLKDITTHWYVSPGRKVDTNPLFPLDAVRSRILGRDDPADDAAEAGSKPDAMRQLVQIATGGSPLNLRRWPSLNPNVIGQIPNGEMVRVERRGSFANMGWLNVVFDGQAGWIVESYTNSYRKGAAHEAV